MTRARRENGGTTLAESLPEELTPSVAHDLRGPLTAIVANLALDEGGGWLVRFVDPGFAWLKVAGFLALQASLAALIGLSLWAVFRGSSRNYTDGAQLE